MELLATFEVIVVFEQIGDIYVAPNHAFPYDRPLLSTKSTTIPIGNNLDLQIHIGMMRNLMNLTNEMHCLSQLLPMTH
jgi:hypothetical protein